MTPYHICGVLIVLSPHDNKTGDTAQMFWQYILAHKPCHPVCHRVTFLHNKTNTHTSMVYLSSLYTLQLAGWLHRQWRDWWQSSGVLTVHTCTQTLPPGLLLSHSPAQQNQYTQLNGHTYHDNMLYCSTVDCMCFQPGHVAWTDATEGQALWQPGGAEEDSRLCEGNWHLHLAYNEEEEDNMLLRLMVDRPDSDETGDRAQVFWQYILAHKPLHPLCHWVTLLHGQANTHSLVVIPIIIVHSTGWWLTAQTVTSLVKKPRCCDSTYSHTDPYTHFVIVSLSCTAKPIYTQLNGQTYHNNMLYRLMADRTGNDKSDDKAQMFWQYILAHKPSHLVCHQVILLLSETNKQLYDNTYHHNMLYRLMPD